jgi:hypothetical protein
MDNYFSPSEQDEQLGDDIPIVIAFHIANDSTPDPDRKTSAYIRSFERQLRQVSVFLKSVALFAVSPVHCAVVADSEATYESVLALIKNWKLLYRDRISLSHHRIVYPESAEYLKYLNRPWSSSRHFIAQQFPNRTKIIHFDTDIILCNPIEDLVAHFDRFDSEQIVGMSKMLYAVNEKFRMFPKPRHGLLDDGINTGVTLFRLDRWRAAFPDYLQRVNQWYEAYGEHFVFPTQDLFNVWLGTHKSHYYELPYEWNVRPTIFRLKNPLQWRSLLHPGLAAFVNGAKGLHAAGGHFTDDTPGWSDVFKSFEKHDMETDTLAELRRGILENLEGCPSKTQRLASRQLLRTIEKAMSRPAV